MYILLYLTVDGTQLIFRAYGAFMELEFAQEAAQKAAEQAPALTRPLVLKVLSQSQLHADLAETVRKLRRNS